MRSYSRGEEVNHWSCRSCLLTNFEQEPANLSPKRYYHSMILWYYSSDWSKLNPLLLSWPSSILVLRIHSLLPGTRTENSSGQATATVMFVSQKAAPVLNALQMTWPFVKVHRTSRRWPRSRHPEQRHWAAPHWSHSALREFCLLTGPPTALGPSRRMLHEDKNALSSCGGWNQQEGLNVWGHKRRLSHTNPRNTSI